MKHIKCKLGQHDWVETGWLIREFPKLGQAKTYKTRFCLECGREEEYTDHRWKQTK